ncbi:hypothetical protein AMAG_00205 [Allomyces macrogynus ATCC 38327]|uniref:Uncharacterized protein n=1 Tax=Allomyces macrogynus (strain ATCC 38327) TaxID=578462 RepID=A0A0L0RVP1_ALLM3|nr:hypothetical protein AMAG_00205 [Allomyces macrogynus ATCC 38327]|eukprot:KNE54214.1 hypothetical protein AMAG_00205 [Allomyces macrogynus ATCC 38327]
MSKKAPAVAADKGAATPPVPPVVVADPNASSSQGVMADMPLIDDDWNAWIGAVFPDTPADLDVTAWLADFHDVISSGIRKRFLLVTKSEFLEWINEHVKTNDLCRDAKSFLDSNPRGTDLPDQLMVRLLYQFLLRVRANALEAKRVAKDAAAATLAAETESMAMASSKGGSGGGAAGKKDDKDAGKGADAGGKKDGRDAPKSAGKRGKDGGARPETAVGGNDAPAPKQKGKLRDRAIPKVKVTPLDDEPADGPENYVLLSHFLSPTVLAAVIQEGRIPLHVVTSLVGLPGAPATEMQLSSLRDRILDQCPATSTVLASVNVAACTNAAAAFDTLAQSWYRILAERHEYAAYYAQQRVITLPGPSVEAGSAPGSESSDERAVVLDLLKYVAPSPPRQSAAETSGGANAPRVFQLEKPPMQVKARTEAIIKACPLNNKGDEWKKTQFARATGLNQQLASHYLDLVHFETLTGQQLDDAVWVEVLEPLPAIQAIDVALRDTAAALTAVQARPDGKLLVTVAPTRQHDGRTQWSPPRKYGFGEWCHLKSRNALPPAAGYVYDSVPRQLAQRVRVDLPEAHKTTSIVYASRDHPTVCKEHLLVTPTAYCRLQAPGQFVATLHHGGCLTLLAASADGVTPPGFMYSTSTGTMCTADAHGRVCFRFPGNRGWRRVTPAGDHVVHAADGTTMYLGRTGTVGTRDAATGEWAWVGVDGTVTPAAAPLPVCRESDPRRHRSMWRRTDGVSCVVERDGTSTVQHRDGTVIRCVASTGLIHAHIPEVGELQLGGTKDGWVFVDRAGTVVKWAANELEVTMVNRSQIVTQDQFTSVVADGHVLDLKTGHITRRAPRTDSPQIPDTIPPGQVTETLLRSPLDAQVATPSLFALHRSGTHTRFLTDATMQLRLLALTQQQDVDVRIAEEPVPGSESSPVVYVTAMVSDRDAHHVAHHRFYRYPRIAPSIRDSIKRAWREVYAGKQDRPASPRVVVVEPESGPRIAINGDDTPDAVAATTDKAPLTSMTETDILQRYFSMSDRVRLIQAPRPPVPAPAEPMRAEVASAGPRGAGNLFANADLAAIRRILTRAPAIRPPPAQITVHLDDVLRGIRATLVPYFESDEGRQALAALAEDHERAPSAPKSKPELPIYARGPRVDPAEDILAAAALPPEEPGSADSSMNADATNPFTAPPALVPRVNRASRLRLDAKTRDASATQQSRALVFEALVVRAPAMKDRRPGRGGAGRQGRGRGTDDV